MQVMQMKLWIKVCQLHLLLLLFLFIHFQYLSQRPLLIYFPLDLLPFSQHSSLLVKHFSNSALGYCPRPPTFSSSSVFILKEHSACPQSIHVSWPQAMWPFFCSHTWNIWLEGKISCWYRHDEIKNAESLG